MLGSWGSGGDEFSGIGVDVVEVGPVVVVVVGVVRRHLLDAGGDAPHRLHVRLRGRPAPCPPPFAPPPPPGSHAPSCLSPGAHGALACALGSLPGPHAPVPLFVPSVPLPVTRALACTAGARARPVPVPMLLSAPPLAHRPSGSTRPVAARLGALLAPLRVLPVPWPLPGSLPCAPVAGTLPYLRAVSPFLDHAPGVPLPLQLRHGDARRRTLGRRGADVPRPPRGEGLGGERLGGAGVGVGGVDVGAVLCALPAQCCCCGGPRRGARGPRGVRPLPLWRAVGRGVVGRGGGAARRGRGPNAS